MFAVSEPIYHKGSIISLDVDLEEIDSFDEWNLHAINRELIEDETELKTNLDCFYNSENSRPNRLLMRPFKFFNIDKETKNGTIDKLSTASHHNFDCVRIKNLDSHQYETYAKTILDEMDNKIRVELECHDLVSHVSFKSKADFSPSVNCFLGDVALCCRDEHSISPSHLSIWTKPFTAACSNLELCTMLTFNRCIESLKGGGLLYIETSSNDKDRFMTRHSLLAANASVFNAAQKSGLPLFEVYPFRADDHKNTIFSAIVRGTGNQGIPDLLQIDGIQVFRNPVFIHQETMQFQTYKAAIGCNPSIISPLLGMVQRWTKSPKVDASLFDLELDDAKDIAERIVQISDRIRVAFS